MRSIRRIAVALAAALALTAGGCHFAHHGGGHHGGGHHGGHHW